MVTAIIAAAGQGKRMERGINKVFIPLLNRPVLVRSVISVLDCSDVDNLIVIVGPGEEDEVRVLLEKMALTKSWQVVLGGSERQYSIANALKAVPAAADGAAVLAVPVKDTIKTVDGEGEVLRTLDRSELWAIQTPQVFSATLLKQAYYIAAKDGFLGTDDSSLVERVGVKVKVVKGRYDNLKITTPEDLVIAEALIRKDEKSLQRVGMGYDVHQLVVGRKLILGGIDVPFAKGLAGHSDADVLVHAIMDSLLGAAALGDIGGHFPDSDSKYKGMSSLVLLATVRQLIESRGWKTGNIDAIVVAERPKLASFIPAMNKNIAEVLGVDVDQINVKATTTEQLGFAGRGEGIEAHAIAYIVRG
ncbi:MAG: 2-C-methyl-D-erythritol 2,4-cyclodiphosphate synthase [Firmicutes bacterium]|nr:2-C-methyl-D-erythritol 2,4-cyclodiphosphate synthase [Bacillota bacterium]